ncbi:MAG TPA: FIST N-terminal domain-containing protein [Acidimicrobiales bacterium]|nr:FIST N-terminal domain-containing protein [Acidimicrobiales bacterium]
MGGLSEGRRPPAFAAALSEHPVTAHATGEVVGQVLETMGDRPDLALLFVTPPHAGALEDAAAAVRATLAPTVLVGCAAESVAGPRREVEQAAAVSLWAARLGRVRAVELTCPPVGDDPDPIGGWPTDLDFVPGALILLADPYSFDADRFFAWLLDRHPGLPVIGGMASAARGPGGNRLTVDGRMRTAGAVGALLPAAVPVATVVSQGCRPIGQPWAVTRAERNVVYELAGRPAMERLLEVAEHDLGPEEVSVINQGGLHLGRVIDEHKADFSRGDFLVRNVLGADREVGAIAVNDMVDVGTTVQFHLRDASTADEDLRALLASRRAQAALLFTCNGRGTRLFRRPDHDADVLADALDEAPVAGFFAAGEFGPVGGHNFVHGFTASIALFGDGHGVGTLGRVSP